MMTFSEADRSAVVLFCGVEALTVFTVLYTDSRRVCSVLIDNHVHKLLCFNVYLPYEDDDVAEEEFNVQLRAITNIIEQYSDAYVIVGGDFNVDLARSWHHTDLLNEFCDELDLWPVIKHNCSKLDYTYHFNMLRFHAIDHFIVSRGLFDGTINSYLAIHDVDNTSDHSPICMQLCLTVERIRFTPRQRVPKPAWYEASDVDIACYKNCLLQNLSDLDLPYSALLCRNVMCSEPSHTFALNDLAASIATACIMLHRAPYRKQKISTKAVVFQVGTISVLRIGLSLYSGIIYG